jgi:hypothetical protein
LVVVRRPCSLCGSIPTFFAVATIFNKYKEKVEFWAHFFFFSKYPFGAPVWALSPFYAFIFKNIKEPEKEAMLLEFHFDAYKGGFIVNMLVKRWCK